jgi:hypothetical protein
MELKDLVNYGPFGVLPRLAVKKYEDRKQDKMEEQAAAEQAAAEQAAAEQAAAEGGMKKGGKVKVSSASKRADGVAQRGKTRGKMV